MIDHRRRTRVPFHARADLHTVGARLVDLETRDLSHKGVYLVGQLPLKAGQGCMVTIHLQGSGEDVPEMRMEGKVVRVGSDGAAVDFVSMDPDTFMHLRNLVILNADNPDEAEREFCKPAFDYSMEKD